MCLLSSSQIYNLGTGTGYSVLQMVQAMEKASGRKVGAESVTPAVLPACLRSPHAGVVAFCRALAVPCHIVLLSLQIKYKITGRREGDVAACYANPELAERELGWKAAFGLDKMCKNIPPPICTMPTSQPFPHCLSPCAGEDLWRWQLQNPTGYSKN